MIRKGLKSLGGLARRFQVKGESGDVLVMDDYGHHPTEIVATLKTAKECWPERRLVVAFQPHRYTRTKDLFDRFVKCFNDADVLLVAPLFSAGENAIEGVDSPWLAQGIKEHGHKEVIVCPEGKGILAMLMSVVQGNPEMDTVEAPHATYDTSGLLIDRGTTQFQMVYVVIGDPAEIEVIVTQRSDEVITEEQTDKLRAIVASIRHVRRPGTARESWLPRRPASAVGSGRHFPGPRRSVGTDDPRRAAAMLER